MQLSLERVVAQELERLRARWTAARLLAVGAKDDDDPRARRAYAAECRYYEAAENLDAAMRLVQETE